MTARMVAEAGAEVCVGNAGMSAGEHSSMSAGIHAGTSTEVGPTEVGQERLESCAALDGGRHCSKLCLPYETLSENSYIIYNIRHHARSLRRKRSGVLQG